MADDRLRIAKTMFIENGKSLSEIAVDLSISIFVLNAASLDQGWVGLRDVYNSKREQADSENSAYMHTILLREAFNLSRYLIQRLANADLSRVEKADVRSDIEALRDYTEGLHHLIGNDRMVRGIKKDAPSVPDPAKQSTGIRYTVVKPPAEERTGTA